MNLFSYVMNYEWKKIIFCLVPALLIYWYPVKKLLFTPETLSCNNPCLFCFELTFECRSRVLIFFHVFLLSKNFKADRTVFHVSRFFWMFKYQIVESVFGIRGNYQFQIIWSQKQISNISFSNIWIPWYCPRGTEVKMSFFLAPKVRVASLVMLFSTQLWSRRWNPRLPLDASTRGQSNRRQNPRRCFIISWEMGKQLIWDVTVVEALAPSDDPWSILEPLPTTQYTEVSRVDWHRIRLPADRTARTGFLGWK